MEVGGRKLKSVEQWLGTRAADGESPGRLAPGMDIGDWRVVAFIGAGLSAEVYRVRNTRYGHDGALKLLVDGSRGLKERFLAEADALRFLALTALPRFMGAGTHEGAPYYVMEYLQPLPEPMPRSEVPRFMNRVAKAVQMLHEAGYIHRDLKPGNILRRRNGEPVLIDLGLIKRRGTGVTDPVVRIGRGISIIDGKPVGVGTLDFAAPEQLLKGEASVQSDIFALGKILRALYEGRPPHCLKSVIRRATREQPGDRYESANDFAAAIRRRNRPFFVLLGLLALAGLAVLAYPTYRPWLVALAEGFVREQQPEVQVLAVQKPKETDSDYARRLTSQAEGGDMASQIALAEAHFYGRGTPTNRAEAVKWYRLAAKAGEASAQASLGLCLLRGWGCERSRVEAVSWYVAAAEQGDLAAMNDLAFCYMHGMGVAKDPETGFSWALKAAERGQASAQALVGECYLTGRGVARDSLQAQTWLFRAMRQGNLRAKMLLETLAQ